MKKTKPYKKMKKEDHNKKLASENISTSELDLSTKASSS